MLRNRKFCHKKAACVTTAALLSVTLLSGCSFSEEIENIFSGKNTADNSSETEQTDVGVVNNDGADLNEAGETADENDNTDVDSSDSGSESGSNFSTDEAAQIKVTQFKHDVKIELGDEFTFNIDDYFELEGIAAEELNVDESRADYSKTGIYDIYVTYETPNESDNSEMEMHTDIVLVEVCDDIAPELTVNDNYIYSSTYSNDKLIEMFGAECSDIQSTVIVLSEPVYHSDYGILAYLDDEEMKAVMELDYSDYEFDFSNAEIIFADEGTMDENAADNGTADNSTADNSTTENGEAGETQETENPSLTEELTDQITEEPIQEGIYAVGIRAYDASGNYSSAYGIFVYDVTSPVISGLKDQTVKQSDITAVPEPSLGSIAVSDNLDGDIDVSACDISLEVKDENKHTYTLTVSYTDRAGNIGTDQAVVTVKKDSGSGNNNASNNNASNNNASNNNASNNNASNNNASNNNSTNNNSTNDNNSPSADNSSNAGSSSDNSGSSLAGTPDSNSSQNNSSSDNSSTDNSSTGNSSTGNSSSGSSNSYTVDSSTFAQQVLDLVNEKRAAEGLSPLTLNSVLCDNANLRATEIVSTFSHTRPDGSSCFTAITTSYYTAGENIAAGYSSPASVMDGWMNSSGHRANILGADYGQLGVGFCYDPNSEYGYYWVQIFTN